MNHCKTCAHWLPNTERADYSTVVHYLRRHGEDYDVAYERNEQDDQLFGQCRAINLGEDLDPDQPAPLAVTQDGSNYRAELFTQAEFGCVMWKCDAP